MEQIDYSRTNEGSVYKSVNGKHGRRGEITNYHLVIKESNFNKTSNFSSPHIKGLVSLIQACSIRDLKNEVPESFPDIRIESPSVNHHVTQTNHYMILSAKEMSQLRKGLNSSYFG